VIIINVTNEPEISGTIPVRADGEISLPLLSDIPSRWINRGRGTEIDHTEAATVLCLSEGDCNVHQASATAGRVAERVSALSFHAATAFPAAAMAVCPLLRGALRPSTPPKPGASRLLRPVSVQVSRN